MFINCDCPLPAAISEIPDFSCGQNLAQIQKLIFQRRQPADTPTFATQILPTLIINWTPLFSAADATKVQITPFLENFIIPPVEAITEGGDDNTTVDGVPIVVGATTITVTGNFRSIPSEVLVALKAYACEGNLTVFMVNQFGKIWGRKTNAGATDFRGIEIMEWFIGDGGNDGNNTQDKTLFRFNLRYGWRDLLVGVTPTDFDARYDLVNP